MLHLLSSSSFSSSSSSIDELVAFVYDLKEERKKEENIFPSLCFSLVLQNNSITNDEIILVESKKERKKERKINSSYSLLEHSLRLASFKKEIFSSFHFLLSLFESGLKQQNENELNKVSETNKERKKE